MKATAARRGVRPRPPFVVAFLKAGALLLLISVSSSPALATPKTVAELQAELARCSKAWGQEPKSTMAPLCEARAHLALGHYREAQSVYLHLKVYDAEAAKTLLPHFHDALSKEGQSSSSSVMREWLRYEQGIPRIQDIARMGWSTEVQLEPGEEPGMVLAGAVLRWNQGGEVLAAPSVLVPLGERRETQTPSGAGAQKLRFMAEVDASGTEIVYELRVLHAGAWMSLHRGILKLPQIATAPKS